MRKFIEEKYLQAARKSPKQRYRLRKDQVIDLIEECLKTYDSHRALEILKMCSK